MHYGIPGIKGERFRRVELDGDLAIRAGILGKSSSLTVPSQPGRTSPVKRGYWVLASILGVEPPPPPPNVKIVPPKQAGSGGDNANVPSMREWMKGAPYQSSLCRLPSNDEPHRLCIGIL